MDKKKQTRFLIVSPSNRWGGVNLDVGFIAKSLLAKNHNVFVLSTGRYFDDCSLFNFISPVLYESVDRYIYRNSTYFKIFLNLLNKIKPLAVPVHHRLNNRYFKKYGNIHSERKKVLKKFISNADEIIICSQLTGSWNEEIIKEATSLRKKIHLRITQQINESVLNETNLIWLKKISTFIHHSKRNLKILKPLIPLKNHVVIDQCVMWESKFLEIPLQESPIQQFYCICRLEATKGLENVILTFNEIKKKNISLHIYGDGSLKKSLQKLAINDNRIFFYGAIPLPKIVEAHQSHDCLIINSSIEGGPYTAIEAMAAGKVIISTRVGAMEERLGIDYPYFVTQDLIALKEMILNLSQLNLKKTNKLSAVLRNKYISRYGEKKIAEAYLDILFS